MAVEASRRTYVEAYTLLKDNIADPEGIKIFTDYPRVETLQGNDPRISVLLMSSSGLSVGLGNKVSSGSNDPLVPSTLTTERDGDLFAGVLQVDIWLKSDMRKTVGGVKMSAVIYRDYLTDSIIQLIKDNRSITGAGTMSGASTKIWKVAFGAEDIAWNPSFEQEVERVRQTIEIPVECKEDYPA